MNESQNTQNIHYSMRKQKSSFFTCIDLSEVLKARMSTTAQYGDSVPSAHSFAGNEIGPLSHCRRRRQTLQLILIQRGRAE